MDWGLGSSNEVGIAAWAASRLSQPRNKQCEVCRAALPLTSLGNWRPQCTRFFFSCSDLAGAPTIIREGDPMMRQRNLFWSCCIYSLPPSSWPCKSCSPQWNKKFQEQYSKNLKLWDLSNHFSVCMFLKCTAVKCVTILKCWFEYEIKWEYCLHSKVMYK